MTETKYKTEKRKANVGERILITNKNVNETRYQNGDVLKVEGRGLVGVFNEENWVLGTKNTKSSSENTRQHLT
ncbi:hypothetical protein BSL056_08975 [Bacillus safensis]|nr:hypothetical protein BSL056_08975 [Bacillus safensis]